MFDVDQHFRLNKSPEGGELVCCQILIPRRVAALHLTAASRSPLIATLLQEAEEFGLHNKFVPGNKLTVTKATTHYFTLIHLLIISLISTTSADNAYFDSLQYVVTRVHPQDFYFEAMSEKPLAL